MAFLVVAAALFGACSSASGAKSENDKVATTAVPNVLKKGGDLQGMLLSYYDNSGEVHTVFSRNDVPEEYRAVVRMDTTKLKPSERDPDVLYVADLRTTTSDGTYQVKAMSREALEGIVEAKNPSPTVPPAQHPSQPNAPDNPNAPHNTNAPSHTAPNNNAQSQVVLYSASWCGACRQAATWFRQEGIDFVEKDIERDSTAHAEMQTRARAQGIRTTGIPVIAIGQRVVQGFNPAMIQRMLQDIGIQTRSNRQKIS